MNDSEKLAKLQKLLSKCERGDIGSFDFVCEVGNLINSKDDREQMERMEKAFMHIQKAIKLLRKVDGLDDLCEKFDELSFELEEWFI